MLMQAAWALPIILMALVAAAFFAGAETALTAASRARLHAMEAAGDRRAALVQKLIARRSRLIAAMLLGGQVVTIGASALVTSLLVADFGETGVFVATIVMTALIFIFSEVLPKTLAIAHPDRFARAIAPAAAFFVTIFGPVTAASEMFVRWLLGRFGINPGERDDALSGHEELRGAVDILHRDGGVERDDRDMFGGLLELSALEVSDVMIHRTKMRTIDADLPPQDIVKEAIASPYTRLPLWRERPDNIVGILHAKDLLRAYAAAAGDARKLKIDDIAQEAWFIPDTTILRDQLREFLKRKTHSALVVDEYGDVRGLVTLEDILEEIVGDIRDEHDVTVEGMRKQRDGSVIVDGSVAIRDLNRAMDWNLPDEEAATVAGLVIHDARAIPEARQVFVFHGFRFEILRKQRNRLAALRVVKLAAKTG